LGTVPAGQLLDIWAFRLKLDDSRTIAWAPSLRQSVESLVSRLRALERDASIEIDADENRRPLAVFRLVSTGEIVGEIDIPLDSSRP